jgi:hypothetical protein
VVICSVAKLLMIYRGCIIFIPFNNVISAYSCERCSERLASRGMWVDRGRTMDVAIGVVWEHDEEGIQAVD